MNARAVRVLKQSGIALAVSAILLSAVHAPAVRALARALGLQPRGSIAVQIANAHRQELGPGPLPAAIVLDGNPMPRAQVINQSHDDGLSTTIWECDAGSFRWVIGSDEIVYVLEGGVNITEEASGAVHDLGPGDVAYFPRGATTLWRIPKYVKKVAVFRSDPADVLSRIRRKLMLLAERG